MPDMAAKKFFNRAGSAYSAVKGDALLSCFASFYD